MEARSVHIFATRAASSGGFEAQVDLGWLSAAVEVAEEGGLEPSQGGPEPSQGGPGGARSGRSLLRVTRIGVEWGDERSEGGDGGSHVNDESEGQKRASLQVDVCGASTHLTAARVEALLSHLGVLADLAKLRRKPKARHAAGRTAKPAGGPKGLRSVTMVLRTAELRYEQAMEVVEADVPDPKKVNFGSRGGQVVFHTTVDGATRLAAVRRAQFGGESRAPMNCSWHFQLGRCTVSADLGDKVIRSRLEGFRAVYRECGGPSGRSLETICLQATSLLLVHQTAAATESAPHSLVVTAQGLEGRWEPDVHLFACHVAADLRAILDRRKAQRLHGAGMANEARGVQQGAEGLQQHQQRSREQHGASQTSASSDVSSVHSASVNDPMSASPHVDSSLPAPPSRARRKTVVALHLEEVRLSAAAADGVEVLMRAGTVLSEDPRSGVVLEQLLVAINGASVLHGGSFHIFRLPGDTDHEDLGPPAGGAQPEEVTVVKDIMIHGEGVRFVLPFRMEVRAIDDAVEDMLRALKLAVMAQASHRLPAMGRGASSEAEGGGARGAAGPKWKGAIRVSLKHSSFEIEEQPLQAWLDSHLHVMREEGRELFVRERLLAERAAEALSALQKERISLEVDRALQPGAAAEAEVVEESAAWKQAWESLQQQAASAYRAACARLRPDPGSGACSTGFESGFVASEGRRAMMLVEAAALDVALLPIQGGADATVALIRKLDEVGTEDDVPFARVFGRHVEASCKGICWQLRDYMFPLLRATSGSLRGTAILATQATVYPPQQEQEVYVGRWRKVTVLRSISGASPPLKFYYDSVAEFDDGEVSYGVGYEPVIFGDLSYAITCATRRANFSTRAAKVPSPTSEARKDVLPGQALSEAPLSNPPAGPTAPGASKAPTDVAPSTGAASSPPAAAPVERSLPWWDLMRYYVHGRSTWIVRDLTCNISATVDPYEAEDVLHVTGPEVVLKQAKGLLLLRCEDASFFVPSTAAPVPALEAPVLVWELSMDWECESGAPSMHYLHALPEEGRMRAKLYDPFRSSGLNLGFQVRLLSVEEEERTAPHKGRSGHTRSSAPTDAAASKQGGRWDAQQRGGDTDGVWHRTGGAPGAGNGHAQGRADMPGAPGAMAGGRQGVVGAVPTFRLGSRDLTWVTRFYSLLYYSSHKLRTFGSWKKFGVPRRPRSGNMSLSRTMSEMLVRMVVSPARVLYQLPSGSGPAEGLTLDVESFGYEVFWSRNLRSWNGEGRRPSFITAYTGLDALRPTLGLDDVADAEAGNPLAASGAGSLTDTSAAPGPGTVGGEGERLGAPRHESQHAFLVGSDCIAVRKQSPQAALERLRFWRLGTKKRFKGAAAPVPPGARGGEGGGDGSESEGSVDDEALTVMLPDNSWRVLLYDLKLLWTIRNRNAVWAWVSDISKAFSPRKPSPSRQWVARKKLEAEQRASRSEGKPGGAGREGAAVAMTPGQAGGREAAEEGVAEFAIHAIHPQFNFQSEEAHGRFLLAAASGQVLARSFMSVVYAGLEGLAEHLPGGAPPEQGAAPVTWRRREISVLLEHVQAHIAPTAHDDTKVQWLPGIPTSSFTYSGAANREAANTALQQVFAPCTMYFQYTRHKGGGIDDDDAKVKPLKEVSFNSPSINASMTSRQFQILLDVIMNLLLARMPKKEAPRKEPGAAAGEDAPEEEEGDVDEDEAYEMVPAGVEEVEQAKMDVESLERECRLLAADLAVIGDRAAHRVGTPSAATQGRPWAAIANGGRLWMLSSDLRVVERRLGVELMSKGRAMRAARAALRVALQSAAQQHQARQKKPSPAIAIAWAIDRAKWTMLADSAPFAEAEIHSMLLHVDRGFDDIGVAQFSIKVFQVRNCMHGAKSNMLLSAWNAPADWSRTAMLRVVGKHGPPVEGVSPIKTFEVDIYPLKIHLTDAMHSNLWEYLFPKEPKAPEAAPRAQDPAEDPSLSRSGSTGRLSRRRGLGKGNATPPAGASPGTAFVRVDSAGAGSEMGRSPRRRAEAALPPLPPHDLARLVDSTSFGQTFLEPPSRGPPASYAGQHVSMEVPSAAAATSIAAGLFIRRDSSFSSSEGSPDARLEVASMCASPSSDIHELRPSSSMGPATSLPDLMGLAGRSASLDEGVVGEQSSGRQQQYPVALFGSAPQSPQGSPTKGWFSSTATRKSRLEIVSAHQDPSAAATSVPYVTTASLSRSASRKRTLLSGPNPLATATALVEASSSTLLVGEGVLAPPPPPGGARGKEERQARKVAKAEMRVEVKEAKKVRVASKAEEKAARGAERQKETVILREEKMKDKRAKGEEKRRAAQTVPQRAPLHIQNLKFSQVELLATYEGSRFSFTDLRLLMDTFARTEYTGTWRRLFSKLKKHIIWGVLKSVAGMQGRKFKDQVSRQASTASSGRALSVGSSQESDSDGVGRGGGGASSSLLSGDAGPSSLLMGHLKRQGDRAGDGFVTTIRGIFNSQKRHAKAIVLRRLQGGEAAREGDAGDPSPVLVDRGSQREGGIGKAKLFLSRGRHAEGGDPESAGFAKEGQASSRPKSFLSRRSSESLPDSEALEGGPSSTGLLREGSIARATKNLMSRRTGPKRGRSTSSQDKGPGAPLAAGGSGEPVGTVSGVVSIEELSDTSSDDDEELLQFVPTSL